MKAMKIFKARVIVLFFLSISISYSNENNGQFLSIEYLNGGEKVCNNLLLNIEWTS